MTPSRPDLTGLPDDVIAYIASLEERVEQLAAQSEARSSRTARMATVERDEEEEGDDTLAEPNEPPTTINVITISAQGYAKRTPRHLYGRQRRGGMGVFDLETSANDAPAFLIVADQADSLVLLTDQGRAFRTSVAELPELPVRARGQALLDKLPLRADERLRIAAPD